MGSKNKMAINYSNEGLNDLLLQFQNAVSEGKYTERIPYTDWRKIKKMSFAVIEYESPFVWIKERIVNECGDDEWVAVLSYKSYDNGFGRFFYDIYVKERQNMECKTVSVKLNEDSPTGKAYWTYDESLSLTNTHLYDNPSLTVSGDAIIDGRVYVNDCGGWDSVATTSNISSLEKRITDLENNMNKDNKENEKMKGFNFDFGPVNPNTIRMSMYGLAVKNTNGTWVSYDVNNMSIMDVDIFNFDGAKFLYKMPVALSEVQFGDVVIHARKPMFVTQVTPYTLFAVDPVEGEVKEIMPTKSPFGFNFVTKVVNFMDGMLGGTTPSAQNPFGNMWMLMMMGEDNKEFDPMVLVMMMSQGNMGGMNPMMLAMLMGSPSSGKDTNMRDMLMLSMMMSNQNQNHVCQCGNQNDVNGKERFKNNPFADMGSDKKPVQDGTAPGEGNGGGTGVGGGVVTTPGAGGSASSGARAVAHSTPEQISEAVKNDLARPSKG